MTPGEMARIHAAAFAPQRGWNADEFTALLAQPHSSAFTAQGGFALTRTVAGETELLTLAVAPDHQRRGVANSLITEWTQSTSTSAETAFLEVAADNTGAIALYNKHGFIQSGLRKAYYARADGAAADALLMTRALTRG